MRPFFHNSKKFGRNTISFREVYQLSNSIKSNIHGRRSSKGFGGHQAFARKLTLDFARKAIGFSVQIKVTSKKKKKRSSLKLRRLMNIELPKSLTQTCPKNMKLSKSLMQYRPNNIKLPEILTL